MHYMHACTSACPSVETQGCARAQLESLKEVLRSETEEKERFRTQAEGIAANAGRYESAARSAKFSADKARAEVAVLEGALSGSKVSCSHTLAQ